MLRKKVKLLLEQLKVCIFAEIVFGVRCTLTEFNKLTSVFHGSALSLIMNFVIKLSRWVWIHKAIAEWIHDIVMMKFIVT